MQTIDVRLDSCHRHPPVTQDTLELQLQSLGLADAGALHGLENQRQQHPPDSADCQRDCRRPANGGRPGRRQHSAAQTHQLRVRRTGAADHPAAQRDEAFAIADHLASAH